MKSIAVVLLVVPALVSPMREARVSVADDARATRPSIEARRAAPTADTAQFLVDGAWLRAHASDPGIVILHIDRRQTYDQGHIPGARFVDMSDISWDGSPAVDVELRAPDDLARRLSAVGVSNDARMVITSTRIIAAARLWLTLDYLGLGDRSVILQGGTDGWVRAGGTLTRALPATAAARLTPRVKSASIVNAEWIRDRLDDPKLLLVDARPDDEFTGADGGMGGMAHPGHIPRARQLHWQDLMEAPDSPYLKPRAELAALYAQLGATPNRTLVTYCMVGLRASVTYFVGRMLGYDIRFYDGSWHDWGTRDLPYAKGPGA